jgi:hypothetical protein
MDATVGIWGRLYSGWLSVSTTPASYRRLLKLSRYIPTTSWEVAVLWSQTYEDLKLRPDPGQMWVTVTVFFCSNFSINEQVREETYE